MGAAKIAHHIFLRVASFLVSDDDAALRAQHGYTTGHRFVVRKSAIAVQLNPIRKAPFDVLHSNRPLRVSRDLDSLPSRQIAISSASRFAKLCFELFYGGIEIDVMLVGMIL